MPNPASVCILTENERSIGGGGGRKGANDKKICGFSCLTGSGYAAFDRRGFDS